MTAPLSVKTVREGRHAGTVASAAVTLAVIVPGLLWAKWVPYAHKAATLFRTRRWPGSDILAVGGVHVGDRPSWHAATTFFQAYLASVWQALLVALLISASVQALTPRAWMQRALNRSGPRRSALAGGTAGMPSMMCACCAAPVAVTLRRSGVNAAGATAFWLANPLLNPAVLIFLVCVAPWQWALTRSVVGVAAVIGVAALVEVASRSRQVAGPAPAGDGRPDKDSPGAVRNWVRAMLWMGTFLLPEYAVLVLLLGACRGWLLSMMRLAHHGFLVVVIAAVVGTLVVIPTAGEIAILQTMALLGVSSATLGALLVTLPAISIPGAAMVGRSFGWRAVVAAVVGMIGMGLLGAAAMALLPSR
ncbi:permease [Mycobacterium paraterrae]|uniref:Permease n=1 Tax=Mycobacterium paraterrae TaxID=577492 RepID=A0ABY3VJA0_9MYCO|nr:permease [Mycobacterium paraterrae]UMB69494.1 permease [Mycobacterium paraterrae]